MKKKNANEEEDVGVKYRLDLLKILEIFRNTPRKEKLKNSKVRKIYIIFEFDVNFSLPPLDTIILFIRSKTERARARDEGGWWRGSGNFPAFGQCSKRRWNENLHYNWIIAIFHLSRHAMLRFLGAMNYYHKFSLDNKVVEDYCSRSDIRFHYNPLSHAFEHFSHFSNNKNWFCLI